MTTIRNINDQYGMGSEFMGATLEAAVARMQEAIRECGPEFAGVVVSEDDYEVIDGDDDTIDEIVALVVAAGPMFSGGTDDFASDVAGEWDDYFDGDVRAIEQWIAAGYWSPAAASAVRDEGHRPSDRPTRDGECAIYALCNDDVSVDEVDW